MDSRLSTTQAHQLEEYFRGRHDQIISFIRTLVETESPSGDVEGSRAVVDLLSNAAGGLSCVKSVERIDTPDVGQNFVLRAFPEKTEAGTILLVGHTDTVHARGSLKERPWRVEGEKIFAPGIFDMKANCGLAIEVLRALEQLQIGPRHALILALTCDEEIGSAAGWPLLEKIASTENVQYVLVLEPSAPGGKAKTGRKGTGIFGMKVEGRAAHAGLDPEKGVSAILEMAKQIERLHALNNSGSGITVNVGVVHGGTRSNVVAAETIAEIDARFSTAAEAKQVEKLFSETKPFDERTSVTVSGGINRPPLERTPQVVELYELARDIAHSIGFELGETQVGGASDGNFLAAMGIPILDGLGIEGDGAHAAHEHILAEDIPRRGALIAGLIASLE
jgi:glutamate carboxypeptidase